MHEGLLFDKEQKKLKSLKICIFPNVVFQMGQCVVCASVILVQGQGHILGLVVFNFYCVCLQPLK